MPATKELLQEGRYRINQEFTPNGSDTVYDAYDTISNSNVVVKQIPMNTNKVTTPAQQDAWKQAFENQAKILISMKHESLLHVKDFFAEIDSQYLVMEAIAGDDLQELLRRNKSPFNLQDVVKWADQLLDALNYLHNHQPAVIHKNIKPENIKLTSDGQIKLLAVSSPDTSDARLTTSLGPDLKSEEALRYAPIEIIWQGLDPASQMAITNGYDERSERILKEAPDPRSDIYSLGSTLYHLVTGTEPVNALERSIEVLDGRPDPLKEACKLNPRVPLEISDVLLKAMELKRENRYDSAVIMRQILKTAIARVQESAGKNEQAAAAESARLAEQARAEQEAAQKRLAEEAEQKRLAAEAEQKRLAAEGEQKRQAAEAEQKRLAGEIEKKRLAAEAEKKRLEAERQAKAEADKKAAEAEKIRKDQEAAKKAAAAAMATASAPAVTAEVSAYHEAQTASAVEADTYSPFASGYDDLEPKKGFALGMPLIAAAAGVIVLGVLAFFLLSGGKETKPPTTAPFSAATDQNAPASSLASAPDPSQVPAADTQAEQPAVDPGSSDAQAQARAAAAARDKKQAAAPTPGAKPAETKKPVTVDDIINDN